VQLQGFARAERQCVLPSGDYAVRKNQDQTEPFSLIVDSRLERLSQIADFIADAAHASGMNDEQVYDVQMAVDEACTNVIQHAYHSRPDGTIDILCERRKKNFVVIIQDFGERFDPKKIKFPKTQDSLSKRRIGGLGLFFMHKLMDRVEFEFAKGRGNRLTMVKKIKK
jgi:serine/threonine-protein kinase RsbW